MNKYHGEKYNSNYWDKYRLVRTIRDKYNNNLYYRQRTIYLVILLQIS